MNRDRRRQIAVCVEKIQEVSEELDCIKDDEQMSLDNLPESLQESERAYQMEDNVESLDCIIEEIGDVIDELQDFL